MPEEIKDSTAATEAHRAEVAKNIMQFCQAMLFRAQHHDDSKLQPPEKEGFDVATWKLGKMEYNSPEYKQSLADMQPTLEHHYAVNDHHPQHFNNGVNGMSLYSLVEMYEDWKASCKRNKNGNIFESIKINKERFGISDQLAEILENTAKIDFAKPISLDGEQK